jgi:GNAT superfamily N-acetyltransferase
MPPPATIKYSERRSIPMRDVLRLYRANGWSSAHKPAQLREALKNADTLVSAWSGAELVGLGYAISDGALVVYYPHLLVHPDHQGKGIGAALVGRLKARYAGFHQHVLIADGRAIEFYERCGFTRAGRTEPMWIYAGDDH